jgi:hypothetical protein
MRVATRSPTRAEIEIVEVVRDTQVAVTVRGVANDLDDLAEAAELLIGGEKLARLLRAQRGRLQGLLGKDPSE